MLGRKFREPLSAGMDDSEREKIESQKEEGFILNLTRMTEDTNAVFPEHFLEFIVHLTNENMKELVVIESGYTSVLFNDVEFAFPACDIEVNRSSVILFMRKIANSFCLQYFIKKYEKAKAEENDAFLMAVQKVHHKARLVLDRPGIKDRIKKCIEERLCATKRKMFFEAFYAISKFVERFGNDPISVIFSRTLSDISTPDSFRGLIPAERESDTF